MSGAAAMKAQTGERKRWPMVPLGEVSKTGSGGTPSRQNPKYYNGTIPWIKSGELNEGFISNAEEQISPEGLQNSSAKLLPVGTVLLAMYGATIGKVARLGIEAATNQAICHITPNPKLLNSDYLVHFLRANKPQFLNSGIGGAQPNISQTIVKATLVPLPPLAEQRRIAGILDKVEDIRRKQQSQLEAADLYLRALFLTLFGDPITNPKGWNILSIDELLSKSPNAIRTGPFGSQLKHSEFTNTGVPVLGIDNVVKNKFRWTKPRCLPREKYENFKRYCVFPGDIIITIMGTTGRVAIAPDDLPECMSTKHLCVLSLDKEQAIPLFLWATLMFDQHVRGQAKTSSGGAIMEGWNMGIIKSLKVRVPPLTEQRRFVTAAKAVTALKNKLQRQLTQTQTLARALSTRAFAGEL